MVARINKAGRLTKVIKGNMFIAVIRVIAVIRTVKLGYD